MTVTLRQRKKGDKISLYLDYYSDGKRDYEYLQHEYLQLYLIPEPEKGKLTKEQKKSRRNIEKLVCSEVQHYEQFGYYIHFRQKKTKGAETLFISEQAFLLLGERRKPEDNVFEGLLQCLA